MVHFKPKLSNLSVSDHKGLELATSMPEINQTSVEILSSCLKVHPPRSDSLSSDHLHLQKSPK